MKAMIALAVSLVLPFLFLPNANAGSVSSGSFTTETYSTTYTEIDGEISSYVAGEGEVNMIDGLNYRNEEYIRDDYSLTTISGEAETERYTITTGTNRGLNGHSVTESYAETEGYVDSIKTIDNAVTGTYEEFSVNLGGISYEDGMFENLNQTVETSYQEYETYSESESSAAYVAW